MAQEPFFAFHSMLTRSKAIGNKVARKCSHVAPACCLLGKGVDASKKVLHTVDKVTGKTFTKIRDKMIHLTECRVAKGDISR